jgi:hypothetical protein
VRFTFESEPITSGKRCNCSICVRKGTVMSSRYYKAHEVAVEGTYRTYEWNDRDLAHCFCATCGIQVFNLVLKLPADYTGPARVRDRRVNLGCVEGLDVYALAIDIIDGRSM